MGWRDLWSADGKEIDQFDTPAAIHQLAVAEGKVVAYQRLLPTIQPHLLSDVLRHLCDGPLPVAADCWEVSRYCVAPAHREGRRAVGSVGSAMIAAAVEWAQTVGVTRLVYEFEPSWILRALQLRFHVRPLGLLEQIERQQVIAAELRFSDRTLQTIREYRGHYEPVIEVNADAIPALLI